jgi:hypothetical protein
MTPLPAHVRLVTLVDWKVANEFSVSAFFVTQ